MPRRDHRADADPSRQGDAALIVAAVNAVRAALAEGKGGER